MSIFDLLGLLSKVRDVAERLVDGTELPIRWTLRRGKSRFILSGTLRREKVV